MTDPGPESPASRSSQAAGAELGRQLERLAMAIALTHPGSDASLLPINCHLAELAGWCKRFRAPAEISDAVTVALDWLEAISAGRAVFDHDTVQKLSTWHEWLQEAADRWAKGPPLAYAQPPWKPAGITACAPGQILPGGTPLAVNSAEPLIVLNLPSDAELLKDFITESHEHLQNIEQGSLAMESNPSDAAALDSVFRAFHTFKGSAAILNLPAIKQLAHELESLLDAARQRRLQINSEAINLILEGGDTLRQLVEMIASQLGGQFPGQPISVPTVGLVSRVRATIAGLSTLTMKLGESLPYAQAKPASAPQPSPPEEERGKLGRTGWFGGPKREAKDLAPSDRSHAFVRVDTVKLDSLIDLVGELAIAKSMVMQDRALQDLAHEKLAANLAQLARITTDLQRTATSLRMVPIRATFQKMARLVRDLSAQQKKAVRLVTSGEETELDRNIVEELNDPLIHMLRNALDHGIETAQVRRARGKAETASISLRAMHRGGKIVITVEDDGHGLNQERILAKARERGLVGDNEAPSEKEIFELIFAPGFSTAETVSDISGRGVGMDVVRNNIRNLRGAVDISSVSGQGTTFTIHLPLTLAIIDGMIVGVGTERYIIPTFSVRESFRPAPGMITRVQEGGEVIRVRDQFNPLLRLQEHFDLPAPTGNPAQSIAVVIESGRQTRCLLVDELLGKQEVVTKSLSEPLNKCGGIAGTAVLGDGRVALVLDVDSLVRLKNGSTKGGFPSGVGGAAALGPAIAA